MTDTILFDLDGTLLPMPSQRRFTELYIKALALKFTPLGYDGKLIADGVLAGLHAMMANDGSMSNEERFWIAFESITASTGIKKDTLDFDDFYNNGFEYSRDATSVNPLAKKCVELLKKKGYTTVLATNPIFPVIATKKRIEWAGLDFGDFEEVTTYENYSYCKPSPDYYTQLLGRIGKKPCECIMIGNDVREDMVTKSMGMNEFLLTDCLINRDKEDIVQYRNGNFESLYEFVKALPEIK